METLLMTTSLAMEILDHSKYDKTLEQFLILEVLKSKHYKIMSDLRKINLCSKFLRDVREGEQKTLKFYLYKIYDRYTKKEIKEYNVINDYNDFFKNYYNIRMIERIDVINLLKEEIILGCHRIEDYLLNKGCIA